MKCFALLVALVLYSLPARAQSADSARVGPTARPPAPARLDTAVRGRPLLTGPPISPAHAFLESLAVPGWGQASLHRSTAGGLFAALEVTSIAMLIQSKKELHVAQNAARDSIFSADSGRFITNPLGAQVPPRRQAVEDWTALLIFTHLLAGADAFVAAHLWDVPVEVGGKGSHGAMVRARIPF